MPAATANVVTTQQSTEVRASHGTSSEPSKSLSCRWVSALEQVLQNLVENAVKYGHEGGNVWVTSTIEGGHVRVRVADDGPGIDPAHHSHLFERFYRVDVGRSREVGGTGLGLAIVKHLVTGMGGRGGVSARPDGGSVFWVSLPEPD